MQILTVLPWFIMNNTHFVHIQLKRIQLPHFHQPLLHRLRISQQKNELLTRRKSKLKIQLLKSQKLTSQIIRLIYRITDFMLEWIHLQTILFIRIHNSFQKMVTLMNYFNVILEESTSYSSYEDNPIPFGCISNTEFERYKWATNGVNSASSWFQNICTTSEDISEIQKKSLIKKTKNFDNKKVYTKRKNIKEEDPVLPTVIDCQDNSKHDDEPVILCNELSTSVTDIASHLANHHVNALPQHVCYWKDCSRKLEGFKARYKLINHLRVHTGERPYLCKFCNKKFSRTENLKIHERTHTGEKPFICTVCLKKFANSSDRKKHMHVHSAARSYQCTEIGCPKNYTHPSSLRKHLRNHQKMSTPSESEISGLPEIFEEENNADSEQSSDSGLASVETGNSFIQQNMALFGCEQTHSNSDNAIFNDLHKPSQNMYNNPVILGNKNSMLNSHTNNMFNALLYPTTNQYNGLFECQK